MVECMVDTYQHSLEREVIRLREELAQCRAALRNIQDHVLITGMVHQLCEAALSGTGGEVNK